MMTKPLLPVWGQPETLYLGFCSRKVIWSLPLAGTVVNLQFTVLHRIAPPEWRWHADFVLYSLMLDTGQIQGYGIATFLHWPLLGISHISGSIRQLSPVHILATVLSLVYITESSSDSSRYPYSCAFSTLTLNMVTLPFHRFYTT